MDHIIIAEDGFYSYHDKGKLSYINRYREGFSIFPIFCFFRLAAKAVWQEPKRGRALYFMLNSSKIDIAFLKTFGY